MHFSITIPIFTQEFSQSQLSFKENEWLFYGTSQLEEKADMCFCFVLQRRGKIIYLFYYNIFIQPFNSRWFALTGWRKYPLFFKWGFYRYCYICIETFILQMENLSRFGHLAGCIALMSLSLHRQLKTQAKKALKLWFLLASWLLHTPLQAHCSGLPAAQVSHNNLPSKGTTMQIPLSFFRQGVSLISRPHFLPSKCVENCKQLI